MSNRFMRPDIATRDDHEKNKGVQSTFIGKQKEIKKHIEESRKLARERRVQPAPLSPAEKSKEGADPKVARVKDLLKELHFRG